MAHGYKKGSLRQGIYSEVNPFVFRCLSCDHHSFQTFTICPRCNCTGNDQNGKPMIVKWRRYNGDFPIVYRSSYELAFMTFVDNCTSVIEWSSESHRIPYVDFSNNPPHKRTYYVDNSVVFRTRENGVWIKRKYLIEVKPYSQTIEPKKVGQKSDERYKDEILTYVKNMSKWNAANEYCKQRGWGFKIITEKELFKK